MNIYRYLILVSLLCIGGALSILLCTMVVPQAWQFGVRECLVGTVLGAFGLGVVAGVAIYGLCAPRWLVRCFGRYAAGKSGRPSWADVAQSPGDVGSSDGSATGADAETRTAKSASSEIAPRYGVLTPEKDSDTPPDMAILEKATKYILENLSRPDLSVTELSDHLNLSRVGLYKKIKTATGRTPIEYIRVERMRHAAGLLRDPKLAVTEVANRVGFNSPRLFSAYFREEYGELPSQYRVKNNI